MDLCLNSVGLETPNINEIFLLNYFKHLSLQLWSKDRLQIGGRSRRGIVDQLGRVLLTDLQAP